MILQKLATTLVVALLLTLARGGSSVAPTEVPFELINRHIMLEAAVKGTPLSFVLDTGDKLAIIDVQRARQLGITFGKEVKVGGIGSSQMTGYVISGAAVVLPAVSSLPQPLVVALPLSSMSARLGHSFDGILGADFIRNFVVEIDYARRVLTLHEPATFIYQGRGESFPITFTPGGHPLVQASVVPLAGTPITGTFTVDIGAGTGVALHSPFATAHHLPAAGDKTIRAMGLSGTGGDGSGRFGRLAAFRIGRVTLTRPLALFSTDSAGAFANSSIDGNIGFEILRRFRVFLDYRRSQIILEPMPGIDAPFDRPMTGLTFETAADDFHRFVVTGVLDESPAQQAGIHAGDLIVAIDGRTTSEMTLTSILGLFEQPVARTMTVRRGAEVITTSLTPRVLVE